MLTHGNMLAALTSVSFVGFPFSDEDILVSYLPLAHSMEQLLQAFAVTYGVQIGFYNGDPLKLVEDL
jgi:long-chain acyl-CoA synthetase